MTDPAHFGNNADGTTPPNGGDGYPPSGQYPPPSGQYSSSSDYPPSGQYPPPPGQYPPSSDYPPPPGQYGPPPGQYGPPPGPFPPPAAGLYHDPTAPYGRHPFTGEPFSDKSKVVAGLLQLIGLFGLLGFGRIYLGQTGFGVAQLVGGIAIAVITCGAGVIVPIIWGIIDAILIFTDKVRDEQGRPLRDGT